MFYGEGGQTYPNAPDQTDYQNSGDPAHDPAPPAPVQAGAVLAPEKPAVAVRPRNPAASPVHHVWPGARRAGVQEAVGGTLPQALGGADKAPPESDAASGRDEPDARRYSLWSGLNAPMMLPASQVDQVSADQAKSMGRADYESHILGLGAESGGVLEKTLPGDSAGARGEAGPREAPQGLFVTLDIDISATPGEYRDAVADVSARSGLRLDDRFPPAFADSAKARVAVRGWVLPSELGQVFGPNIMRLKVEHAPRIQSLPDAPLTELLVGIRIPPGSPPGASLSAALERLSAQAAFRVKRIIGYQTIPGTSQMVLVVAGKVPVSSIPRVLGDRDIVKVVPSPDAGPAAAERPASRREFVSRRFFSYAASREPRLLLGTLLLTFALAGTLFARSRKG